MEILKVGDQFKVPGYKAITLAGDMSANISEFARVNKLSQTRAEKILLSNRALKNFAASLIDNDKDEDGILLDSSALDNIDGLLAADSKAGASGTQKTGGGTYQGVTISYKYDPAKGESAPKIKASGNTIKITGSNCEVDITACTNPKAVLNINGSNIKVNIGAQLKKIVNNASGAEINGGTSTNDVIENNAANVTINARGGSNTIKNNKKGKGSTINGGSGTDTITNNAANATIDGGAGNDKITNNSSGKDSTIKGGAGNDTIINKAQKANVFGGAGNDTITNTAKNAEINGNAGNDTITNKGAGSKITGGLGDDTITNTGKGASINGGLGSDSITLKGANTNVNVNANGGTDTITINTTSKGIVISNFESTDKINYKKNNKHVTTKNKESSTDNGEIGSLNMVKAALGLSNIDSSLCLTDSQGRISKIYTDATGAKYYTISYASDGTMTTSYFENDVKKSELTTASKTNTDGIVTGYLNTKKTFKADGSIEATEVKGYAYTASSGSATLKYSVVNNFKGTGNAPTVDTSDPTKAVITFVGGRTLNVNDGSTITITATGMVTVGSKQYAADGTGIAQGTSEVGSVEQIASLLGDTSITATSIINPHYDASGRLESFEIGTGTNKKTYTISYTSTNTKITVVQGNTTTESIYKNSNSKLIERTITVQGSATGSRTVTKTKYNESTGALTETEYKGFTNNSTTPNYTIVNKHTASGNPTVTAAADKATIKFSDTKSIEIKNGESVEIASNGTVTVTAADGKITVYNASGTKTSDTIRTVVSGGYVDDITSYDSNGNATSHTYKGYQGTAPNGTLKYTVINNYTGSSQYPSVSTTATTATINFASGISLQVPTGATATILTNSSGNFSGVKIEQTVNGNKVETTYNTNKQITSIKTTFSNNMYTESRLTYNTDGSLRKEEFKGYDAAGKLQFTVINNKPATAENGYPRVTSDDGQQATIKLSANAADITVPKNATATINSDGTVRIEFASGIVRVYKTDGTEDEEQAVIPEIQYAPESSQTQNNSDVANILSLFNLSVNSTVERTITQNGKIVGVVVNGVTYEIVSQSISSSGKSYVTETRITDADGNVTNDTIEIKTELERIKREIAVDTDKFAEIIAKYLSQHFVVGVSDAKTHIANLVKAAIGKFSTQNSVSSVLEYVMNSLTSEGFYMGDLKALLRTNSEEANELKNLGTEISSLMTQKATEEAKNETTIYVQVGTTTLCFQATYKGSSEPTISESNGVITITGNNCSIVALGTGLTGYEISINGSGVTFDSKNMSFSKITNNAASSTITGSHGNDIIVNNGANSTINGGNGNDTITNRGQGSTVNGNAGDDTIINAANASTINGGKDNDTIVQYATTGTVTTKGNGTDTQGQDVINYVNGFDTTSITKDSGDRINKILPDTTYEVPVVQTTTATEETTSDEDDPCTPRLPDEEATPTTPTPTPAVTRDNVISYMTSSTAFRALGMSTSDQNTFITKYMANSEYNSYDKLLTLIKQIEVIYNQSDKDADTISYLKACMTGTTFSFNNEILADAKILVDAANQTTMSQEAYIKSQMIKDGSNWTTTQMFSNTSGGDVVEKSGKLYYNNGTEMIELALTADQYTTLFPPVKRFIVEQANNDDCFFIATTLVDCMENVYARGQLLSCFEKDPSNPNNIVIRFPGGGIKDYPVTFTNGNLKTTSNILSGAKGLQMLEQAYALAKFAQVTDSDLSINDIKNLHNANFASAVSSARSNSSNLNNATLAMTFYEGGWFAADGTYAGLNYTGVLKDITRDANQSTQSASPSNVDAASLKEFVDNKRYIVTIKIGNVSIPQSIKDTYHLSSGHQYSIESIDTVNGTTYVNIKNPWDSYRVIRIPLNVFREYFTRIDYRRIS